jgi:hypothetical protein
MKKILSIRPYPLEKEAIARIGQCELNELSHEELLDFSKQNLLLLDQLTFYAGELLIALEKMGVEVEPGS